MSTPAPASEIAAVRRFNRFYTRQLGLLDEGLLGSGFTLTQARVLFELAHHKGCTASELAAALRLDAGYLSRILKAFEADGLIERSGIEGDARAARLSLTAAGRAAFAPLDKASKAQVRALLGPLPAAARGELLASMQSIETLLAPAEADAEPYRLRPHRPGDIGWVTHRQAVLYHAEYGWDEGFEALVARIGADFIDHFDPSGEYCWIAERHGRVVGSVFCVRESAERAKLRMLYVDPEARGLGIGARLTAECIAFARERGYQVLTLWTNAVLVSARRIYEAAGFRLVKEERHHSFGHDLVGQHWDLDLRA